jgi:hypothetical protein
MHKLLTALVSLSLTLTDQSHQSKKRDVQTIEFPLEVAANGEQVVTYTVHYSR